MTTGKVTLERIDQKLDDVIDRVNRIDAKVTVTNGKVAEAFIEINKVKTIQDMCPAKNNYIDDKKETSHATRAWIMWIPTIITTIIGIVVFFK